MKRIIGIVLGYSGICSVLGGMYSLTNDREKTPKNVMNGMYDGFRCSYIIPLSILK
jgi:hypothetical protein